ncbi:MAG: hypothetical protein ACO1OB_21405 [Archangium sp.]
MHRPLLIAALLISSACLTTVDQRWCDAVTPCSPGFVCTSTFHCIPGVPARDGGAGGGGGSVTGGGSATGGGMAMGGGVAMGGGGGVMGGGAGGGGGLAACDSNCESCCVGRFCFPLESQSPSTCGPPRAQCVTCSAGETCRPQVGCFPLVVMDGGSSGAPGSPCEEDFECGTDGLGLCIPEEVGGQFTGWPGGYCTRDCVNMSCPLGGECVQADDNGQPTFICLSDCTTDAQCRMGYTCATFGNTGVCVP